LNQTGIIDLTAKRCFVMPLDRSHVVPPKNMRDLIVKVSFFEAKYSFLKLREYSKN
jgi:hypothetical protein